MTSLTFNLIVILIAAPIWFLVVLAKSADEKDVGFDAKAMATAMLIGLTLSVAWGIRLIVLNL